MLRKNNSPIENQQRGGLLEFVPSLMFNFECLMLIQ